MENFLRLLRRDFLRWQFGAVVAGIVIFASLNRPVVAFFLWTTLRIGSPIVPIVVASSAGVGFLAAMMDARRRGKLLRQRRLEGADAPRVAWLKIAWMPWLMMFGAHAIVAIMLWSWAPRHDAIQSAIDFEMEKFRSGNLGW